MDRKEVEKFFDIEARAGGSRKRAVKKEDRPRRSKKGKEAVAEEEKRPDPPRPRLECDLDARVQRLRKKLREKMHCIFLTHGTISGAGSLLLNALSSSFFLERVRPEDVAAVGSPLGLPAVVYDADGNQKRHAAVVRLWQSKYVVVEGAWTELIPGRPVDCDAVELWRGPDRDRFEMPVFFRHFM